jgi:hypothetical protein
VGFVQFNRISGVLQGVIHPNAASSASRECSGRGRLGSGILRSKLTLGGNCRVARSMGTLEPTSFKPLTNHFEHQSND